jgi:hypothetical protein
MPNYLVEDLQTEEQVEVFEANDINEAIDHVHDDMTGYYGIKAERIRFEVVDDVHGNIAIQLPYGARYVYDVGEEGK